MFYVSHMIISDARREFAEREARAALKAAGFKGDEVNVVYERDRPTDETVDQQTFVFRIDDEEPMAGCDACDMLHDLFDADELPDALCIDLDVLEG